MELGKGLLVRFLAISCYNNYYHLFTLRPTIQTPGTSTQSWDVRGLSHSFAVCGQSAGAEDVTKFKESHAISNMTRNRQKMEVYKDYKGSPEELDEVKVN
ncbi:hypothetical protein OS493_000523 [Desmophyllum pertusum]|uniref:Uncharacterized protein n=1 Tax=Desmophyllum pertusum TaxID=174260 RepID=A0A9X0A784_9CNID|nr:hypothetical protein OS493_000523 [Desmophyllum pertusum]